MKNEFLFISYKHIFQDADEYLFPFWGCSEESRDKCFDLLLKQGVYSDKFKEVVE